MVKVSLFFDLDKWKFFKLPGAREMDKYWTYTERSEDLSLLISASTKQVLSVAKYLRLFSKWLTERLMDIIEYSGGSVEYLWALRSFAARN